MGARASAIGYTSSCLRDTWSLFNNVGGLAQVKALSAAFTYDAHGSFRPFHKMATAVAIPFGVGVAGVGMYHFGDQAYNEQILTSGFSTEFGLASLGLKLNYVQYNATGFGRKALFTISFGGIAQLTPKISFGAHITNLNQPKLTDANDEQVPTILTAGILFKISDKTLMATEIEKDLSFKPTWKAGLEYHANAKFWVRSGINLHPNAGFFGVGFKSKKFTLDYSFKYSSQTGPRHQASVGYTMPTTKK